MPRSSCTGVDSTDEKLDASGRSAKKIALPSVDTPKSIAGSHTYNMNCPETTSVKCIDTAPDQNISKASNMPMLLPQITKNDGGPLHEQAWTSSVFQRAWRLRDQLKDLLRHLALTGSLRTSPNGQKKVTELREDLMRLEHELIEPRDVISDILGKCQDLAILKYVVQKDIINHIPEQDNGISYESLAQKVGADRVMLTRGLKHLSNRLIFEEVGTDRIRHSSFSRALKNPGTLNLLRMAFKSVPEIAAAMNEVESLFDIKTTPQPNPKVFVKHEDNPKQRAMFNAVMDDFAKSPSLGVAAFVDQYDWPSLAAKGATVVDIGGNEGQLAVALANRHPGLRIMVQDLPATVESAKTKQQSWDLDISSAIEFQAHSFFDEQNVAADVYILRWILHMLPDLDVEKLLRALKPAMKANSRILINEALVDGEGDLEKYGLEQQDQITKRRISLLDLQVNLMHQISKERTAAEFEQLVQNVGGLQVKSMRRFEGHTLSLIEIVKSEDQMNGVHVDSAESKPVESASEVKPTLNEDAQHKRIDSGVAFEVVPLNELKSDG